MTPSSDFFDLLRSRRSIRKYASRPVADDAIELLKEAALRCPTSHNRRHWEFVFVDDIRLLRELSRSKPHGASFLQNAPLGIVICGDESITDVWIEDCAIASHTLHLAAHSLGLGSCWIQIRARAHNDDVPAEDFIRKLLDIPTHFCVLAILAVGWPEKILAGHPKEKLPLEKIHMNHM